MSASHDSPTQDMSHLVSRPGHLRVFDHLRSGSEHGVEEEDLCDVCPAHRTAMGHGLERNFRECVSSIRSGEYHHHESSSGL